MKRGVIVVMPPRTRAEDVEREMELVGFQPGSHFRIEKHVEFETDTLLVKGVTYSRHESWLPCAPELSEFVRWSFDEFAERCTAGSSIEGFKR